MSKDIAKRLGRGLSSLISVPGPESDPVKALPPEFPPPDRPNSIKVGSLRPNPFQPRKDMDPQELKALSESIRTAGVLQPVLVRAGSGGGYEIIAGERRWRAAQMVGLSEIPVVVREASDEQMLELALVENIFRDDLNPIERAMGYRQYCDQFGLTTDEVAQRLGEDRSTVANYLRLLELPIDVKDWVAGGRLSMGHARCLLGLRAASDLIQTAKLAMDRDLSVRALEQLVREKVAARESASKPPTEPKDAKRPQIRSLEQSFAQALGTKVDIAESRRKGSGKIVIHYFNLDDFDRIIERLRIPAE
jgi:ParB family transcriptional regulator, chromosome partitioning protein